MPQRLDKLVSKAAGCSRKQAGALIKDGRVSVDGKTALLPDFKVDDGLAVALDGDALHTGLRYFMLNKPGGVLCATRDKKIPTVLDLLPENIRRGLFPAGRLDRDTEGFVLLTDDGALAHRLLSPRSKVPKTYRAVLDRHFRLDELQEKFAQPLDLGGGDVTTPASLTIIRDGDTPEVEIVIYEGMFHQVKRMFGIFSLNILSLRRVKIGGLELDPALGPGEYRPISEEEISAMTQKAP